MTIVRSIRKALTRLPLIPLAVALLIIICAGAYGYHRYHKSPQSTRIITAGTPVKAPATASPTTPPPKNPINNSSAGSGRNGGATDTQGSTKSTTASSQWVTSASGYITVKQPVADWKLKDGDSLVGTAKIDEVHYRLKDNKVGVIAQGSLNVSGGNFSGVLHFQPQGTGGQLDIFSTDPSGVEYNEVQINVSF